MISKERQEKLLEIQTKRNRQAYVDVLEALEEKIKKLAETLDVGVTVKDMGELINQLGTIRTLRDEVENLRVAIGKIKLPDNIEIKGIDDLRVKLKEIPVKHDFKVSVADKVELENLVKAIDKLTVKAAEEKAPYSQLASKFMPVRRVRKVGNSYIFDDEQWVATSGVGSDGGGSSSIDTSALATHAKQDTQQTALDAIKTAAEIIDNVVAGSEAQVDVVGALPAGNNNIGDVDIASALPAGTNAIGKLAANSGVDIGDVDVTSISAGANLIGDVDIQPRTTGGWSVANFTSGDTYTALTATAQVIKASAGKFGGYYIYNPNVAATYVLVYDIAAASVTVGTSTAKLVFCIPAMSAANLEILAGIPFANAGWSIAAATTGGGNGAPAVALEAMVYFK